jgi:hypothetical protein
MRVDTKIDRRSSSAAALGAPKPALSDDQECDAYRVILTVVALLTAPFWLPAWITYRWLQGM